MGPNIKPKIPVDTLHIPFQITKNLFLHCTVMITLPSQIRYNQIYASDDQKTKINADTNRIPPACRIRGSSIKIYLLTHSNCRANTGKIIIITLLFNTAQTNNDILWNVCAAIAY